MTAEQTLAAIEAASKAEGEQENAFRHHLGASVIGEDCIKRSWLAFRWAAREAFPGRLYRLFSRGDRAEGIMAKLLRSIGVTVHEVDPATGKQWRVKDVHGHLGGSADGLAWGLPELPGQWFLPEYKTHNNKSFVELKDKGLYTSKPKHAAQMQVYMPRLGVTHGLYMAVNKDTDELHAEIVTANQIDNERFTALAWKLVFDTTPPERITPKGKINPGWHKCKFCPMIQVCMMQRGAEKNCRTCLNAYPGTDGEWHCRAAGDTVIPRDFQLKGCDAWRVNPALYL